MDALQELNEETREIIVMRNLEGLSVKEIAAVLEMEVGTANHVTFVAFKL